MCGIAGFCGDFSPSLLGSMRTALAHRGPDDSGEFHSPEDRLGLTHTRLSILDLSPCGHQPMQSASGRSWISFNGEIYNFKELTSLLPFSAAKLRSSSDTEVLLELLEARGPDILPKLNGIFAFAYWNSESKTLLLARDHFGVKPLYVGDCGKGILFASEIKALLHEPSLSREVDPRAITSYLTFNYAVGEMTPLKHVRRLKPGHAMLLQNGAIRKAWQYYEIPLLTPEFKGSLASAEDALEVALTSAVRGQLISDAPLGAFLSGGLDSSLLVALAARCRPAETIPCYTIASPRDQLAAEGFQEDLPFARLVAERLRVPLTSIPVKSDVLSDLPFMMYQLDEPQPDLTALNVFYVAQAAHRHGVKVLIAGTGGDDLFTGYRRHIAVQYEWAWRILGYQLRNILRSFSTRFLSVTNPISRRVRRALQYAEHVGQDKLISYYSWLPPQTVLGLLSPDLRRDLGGFHPFDPLRDSLSHVPQGVGALETMLYIEKKHFLGDHNFNYFDKMAMAAGVECRVPFLDPEVVALAESFPARWKQRGLVSKFILKKVAERHLPVEIIKRKKTGFGPPQREFFLQASRGSPLAPLLDARVIERRGLFDPAAVSALMQETLRGEVDGSYALLGVACFELWCTLFIDQPSPRAVRREGGPLGQDETMRLAV